MSGEDTLVPTSGTTVFQITNPASGYTVKRGTISTTSGSDTAVISGSIGTSATAIPTFSSVVDVNMAVASGGGFDDPGDASANGTGSLIFEKSGDTTFTYSFNFGLQAECEGSGGE